MNRYEIINTKDLYDELIDIQDEIERLEDEYQDDTLTDDERIIVDRKIKDILNDARYQALLGIEDELIGMVRNGENLISVDDFTAYMKENYNDMYGNIPDNLVMYIDWESLANDIAQNNTVIDFDGNEYYII